MKNSGIKIVAGLGNPGREYSETFHNAGFLAAMAFAGGGAKWKKWKDIALVGDTHPLVFLPYTYMNNSGIPLKKYADYKNIRPEEILVVCDDFSIELGSVRLRPKGSSGGQKGLKSIIENFASDSIARLRVGIGPLDGAKDPSKYVLEKLKGRKKERFERVIMKAAEIIDFTVKCGLDDAMSKYNSITVD